MQRERRGGFSLIELLIVIAIILILAAVAIPRADKALMNARETAAVKQIHNLHQAQTQYYSQYGRYATTLVELGPPASGQDGPAGASLIGSDLAAGTKGGYNFVVQGTPTGYSITANPVAYNSTGRRSFFSDQTLLIRENWGQEPASAASKEIK